MQWFIEISLLDLINVPFPPAFWRMTSKVSMDIFLHSVYKLRPFIVMLM